MRSHQSVHPQVSSLKTETHRAASPRLGRHLTRLSALVSSLLHSDSVLLHYSCAVIGVVLMTILRYELNPVLHDRAPFTLFFVAVVFSAWIGGVGSGAVTVLLSAVAVWYFFIPPTNSFTSAKSTDTGTLIVFLGVGILISMIGEAQRRSRERVEEARRETHSILESIADGFFAIDRDDNLIYVNQAAGHLTGRASAGMSARKWQEVFAEILGGEAEDRFCATRSQQASLEYQNFVSAESRWFHIKLYPADKGGLAVYFQDITVTKMAQEALRDSEQKLATTLRSIGDAVITTDKSGCITFLNPVAERLTGWSLAEAVGRSLQEVFVIVSEQSREPVEDPVAKVIQTRSVQGLASDTLLLSRNGEEYPIDDSAAPIYSGADMIGIVLVFRDFTARRQEIRALQESEERFRVLAEAMPQFVWVADLEGILQYLNQRWTDYTGQTLEQTGPHTQESVIHPEDAPEMYSRWNDSRASGADYEFEFRCRSASDGIYRWFLARSIPVKDSDGTILRWVGTSTNIDAQKRAEDEIISLNTRLHLTVYESSHRIKNQFQTLAATVDMALLDGGEEVPAAALRRVGAQIRTLSVLQDMLTLESKADTGGVLQTLSSRALLTKVLEAMKQAPYGERIAYKVAEVELSVKAGTALALIMNETVTNALKHGKQGVEVTLEVEGDMGTLEICDDGPGFPADFDPDTSANTGLELIQVLASHDLGGTVRYENREQGGGRVAVSFPL